MNGKRESEGINENRIAGYYCYCRTDLAYFLGRAFYGSTRGQQAQALSKGKESLTGEKEEEYMTNAAIFIGSFLAVTLLLRFMIVKDSRREG